MSRTWLLVARVAPLLALGLACDRILPDRPDLELPPLAVVDSIYDASGVEFDEARYDGNVVEIVKTQPLDQLQGGGSLWARLGPYIYLFNPATRSLFESYAGVAAVRAVTRTSAGTEIARATLLRSTLNEATWPRALRLLSHAVTEGTDRPRTVRDFVVFGEERTEHQYNREFVPGGGR